MRHSPELIEALEVAYRIFADVAAPRMLEASPLRDASAIHRALTSGQLAAIANADIGPYAGWAVTTVGTGKDYQYFLPRILELAVSDSSWMGVSPAVIASRLEMADWRTWPESQQAAVKAVFAAAFSWTLANSTQDPDAWLAGIALIGGATEEARQKWRESESLTAAQGLASFVIAWRSAEQDGELAPPYWTDVPYPERSQTRGWLLSEESSAKLRQSLSTFGPEEAWLIPQALDLL
ncbi:hypothetical protein [Caulobacter vibrioides]|uniref:Uncharacterized protein n=2 Tax=Caulobacter vibrioides TaxID=155892 RepID=Q9ABG9_CAUVC|nr:hypothetical protein [Caulobacter vibrioides]YP_002515634.1 hypothetical protein CCNA_00259 [Caulobacter vibrioides NA1000]AAK22245.1 hypothetical protein CC_0258 [Caulobacter vibrioides CB15]ACL93726.1 hypothetical protein CCNA_00259 [Caulobacter vibrioides NA1000]ATC27089.1 hypothetical protein CA607_01315 [Caulobacter vibrioides]QXZ52350.1 hypothetical protein KZH45_01325 [Caulobacter vibrioides]